MSQPFLAVRAHDVHPDTQPTTVLATKPDLVWTCQGRGVYGWGRVALLQASGSGRLADLAGQWRDLTAEVGDDDKGRLRAFVSATFSDRSAASSIVVVPQVIVDTTGPATTVTTVHWCGPHAHRCGGTVDEAIVVDTENHLLDSSWAWPAELPLNPDASDPTSAQFDHWISKVHDALGRFEADTLEKVVLARDHVLRSDEAIAPHALAAYLAEHYPTCWTFEVDNLIGATPELLVSRRGTEVVSRVLAGTAAVTASGADYAHQSSLLLSSLKDRHEHEVAVRTVAQALAKAAGTDCLATEPFALRLPNVLHLATDIHVELPNMPRSTDTPRLSVLDLADRLHPTGAVCGTPPLAAQEWIESNEGIDRGRYAGPVGWLDGYGDGEIGLALRCAQLHPDNRSYARLFAGCGIVAGSNPHSEWAESEAKMLPMQQALGGPCVKQGPPAGGQMRRGCPSDTVTH